ncbi:uncharacterized protein LOC8267778 [Ricinus communis]|uniref:MBD domain-containing protein n=1 Tax=Ricinus communis TaxID=3988 RepID=B9SXY5_RICCO|nr:uncharacterized protein LOC8267778 [Ricinus communis]EEF31538.1 conserved hypothetical protein [Ricinus communis]|eukprot:XP_002530864.1 uncharacterized protein LOC8267778 [Ricinus communis]
MERSGESKTMKKGKKRAMEVRDEVTSESSTKMEKKTSDSETGTVEQGHHQKKRQVGTPSFLSYYQGGTYKRSPETMKTLANIERRRQRKPPNPGSIRTLHDNTSHGYGWLLPGWLGEERVMDHGRIYRYYYDPSGRLYRSQDEVLIAWEQTGLIVLDK